MNGPVNNTFINEALPLNTNVKLQIEQDNITGMTSVFLPHYMTEAVMSSEHQIRFVQLKEEPLDINGDIEKDPLAIEESNVVKLENLKVENKVESEISLNEEVSLQLNLNMKTDELQINDKYLHTVKAEEIGFYPDYVTIDKGLIKGSTKNCVTYKRCINNSVHDGIIKEKSSECKHAYGDATIEDLVDSVIIDKGTSKGSTKNRIIQKKYVNNSVYDGIMKEKSIEYNQSYNSKSHLNIHTKMKNYDCNFCQKSFSDVSYLKIHLATHMKEKNDVCKFCQKSFNIKSNLTTT
ncbi:uncharacterized protein LOC142333658 isoform X2 [Lycorma delicatula]